LTPHLHPEEADVAEAEAGAAVVAALDTVDVDAVNDVGEGSCEVSETFLVVICVVDGSIAVDVLDVNDPSCD